MPQRPTQSASRNDHLLANVALLYYGEGLTQNEIATRMGVSRASVVNYLREGRERGIVDVHIKGQALASSSLSREIRNKFGLSDVYIAQYAESGDALVQTARVGAMALLDIVKPGDHLGVAWGETIKNIADQLPNSPIGGTSVSQIIGAMYSTRLPSAEACSIRIANRIGAECFTLHAPAVLSSAELARALKEEPTIKAQLERLDSLDVALFSAGDCSGTTHMVEAGIASASDMHEAIGLGARGIVCSRFIDAQGRQINVGLDEHMISIDIPALRRAKKRIMVTAGLAKFEAAAAALRGNLVTHLVVDETLANKLFES